MDKPTIGIRQADGSFYSIMDDAQGARKRMVLTASRPDQHGVRIDLYRSEDGQIDDENLLGTLSLDDAAGVGMSDIEFHLELDAEGQLQASANLPGQPPRTLSVDLAPFRGARADSDILADDALAMNLDDLGESFDADPVSLDLPDADPAMEDEAPTRSDSEILADDLLADVELDTLDEFGLDDEAAHAEELPAEDEMITEEEPVLEEETVPDLDEPLAEVEEPLAEVDPLPPVDDFDLPLMDEPAAAADDFSLPAMDDVPAMDDLPSLDAEPAFEEPMVLPPTSAEAEDDFSLPPMDDLPAMDDLPDLDDQPAAAENFDLGDLEEGFGTPEPASEQAPVEEWEKISLDDLEPMEFMDTGDEISRPSSMPRPSAEASAPADDDFRMDDDGPLELGSLDDDLSDLPDLDDLGENPPRPRASAEPDGFVGMDEPAPWDVPEPIPTPVPKTKPAKAPKAPKAASGRRPADEGTGGLDKTALFLSLAALSLLVLLILVLLFLNMVKAPTVPVIQPEVLQWKPTASLSRTGQGPGGAAIDLADPVAREFQAQTVLEVPADLMASRVSLRLPPGDTVADATRRFGPPARTEGDLLFW